MSLVTKRLQTHLKGHIRWKQRYVVTGAPSFCVVNRMFTASTLFAKPYLKWEEQKAGKSFRKSAIEETIEETYNHMGEKLIELYYMRGSLNTLFLNSLNE